MEGGRETADADPTKEQVEREILMQYETSLVEDAARSLNSIFVASEAQEAQVRKDTEQTLFFSVACGFVRLDLRCRS